MSDATQVPQDPWLQRFVGRTIADVGPLGWVNRPLMGWTYPHIQKFMAGAPQTPFQQHLQGAVKFLTPTTYGDPAGELVTDIGKYFTGPVTPAKPAAKALVPWTPDKIAALSQPPKERGGEPPAATPSRRSFEISQQIPQSPASDFPAPPPVAVPNFPELPNLPRADYSAARQWMERANPVMEKADPNSVLVSVLGGMAAGAAQPITGKGQIGMLLARIGAGAAQGYANAKVSDSERERRNEVARTGYALRMAGFEGNVAAQEAETNLRQAEMGYRRNFEIARYMADAINQQRGQQYGYQTKKWELEKSHQQQYGPKISFHGDNIVTGQREGDRYKYSITPTKDSSVEDLTKTLAAKNYLLRNVKLEQEITGSGPGSKGGDGKGGPSRQLATESRDALATRIGGYGNTPYAQSVGGLVKRVVDSELWNNMPPTSVLKQTHAALIEKDKNLKNLYNLANVPGAPLDARLQFRAAFAEKLFDALMGNQQIAGTIFAELEK